MNRGSNKNHAVDSRCFPNKKNGIKKLGDIVGSTYRPWEWILVSRLLCVWKTCIISFLCCSVEALIVMAVLS
jgi:hypothetical protein